MRARNGTDVSGMSAEPLIRFLEKEAKLPTFPLVKDFNWAKLSVVLSTVAFMGVVIRLVWEEVQKILSNKNAWAVVSIVYLPNDRFWQ